MNLTSEQRRELRALGWSVLPRKANRPTPIPSPDVLQVDDDVTIDVETSTPLLAELDDAR